MVKIAIEEEEGAGNRKVLWEPNPEEVEKCQMRQFGKKVGVKDGGYEALWKWSVANSDEFWTRLLDFTGMKFEGETTPVKVGAMMPDVTYYPNVKINFAENLLRYSEPGNAREHDEAIVSISEARPIKRWTFAQARDDAARVRVALEKLGLDASGGCGAYMPNIGETIVAMLGCTSTGAVWTSCSPDFGEQAVIDRFVQVGPKVLFACDGYIMKKEAFSITDKVEQVVEALIPAGLERVVLMRMLPTEPVWASEKTSSLIVEWDDFLAEVCSSSSNPTSSPSLSFCSLCACSPRPRLRPRLTSA